MITMMMMAMEIVIMMLMTIAMMMMMTMMMATMAVIMMMSDDEGGNDNETGIGHEQKQLLSSFPDRPNTPTDTSAYNGRGAPWLLACTRTWTTATPL